MATTSLWRVNGEIGRVLKYAGNEEKTVHTAPETEPSLNKDSLEDVIAYASREEATQLQKYVTGINCSVAAARQEMLDVKKHFQKTGGTIAYHGYQSFAEGEVTPQQAHSIGIALATELWGNRYQVLVATHLDKESHLHNHFVINTVSFVDGIKFHRTKDDYRMMQEVSDRLCKEAGLSVVKEHSGRGKSYSEWMADQNGRPTIRSGIRHDIDLAVAQSVTGRQFVKTMEQMGYELKLYSESGALLKYPALKPPGAKGFFRFHKLGEGYRLDQIGEKILANTNSVLPFDETANASRKVYTRRPKRKLHGIYALYIRYCYDLHIIVKNPKCKKLHFELRQDALKLTRLDEQTRFMGQHQLQDLSDIKTHRAAAQSLLESLSEERKILRNSLKVVQRKGEEDKVTEIKETIMSLTAQTKELRREIKLCDEIESRADDIKLRLEYAKEYRSGKEIENDEYIRRRGRTGREDESRSR